MPLRNPIRFETPENVQVGYEVAGLGTRFVAWFVDQIIVWLLTVLLIVLLMVVGVSFDSVFVDFDRSSSEERNRFLLYMSGIMALIWGFGSFLYFCGCELLMRGQTIGKRATDIRVVKTDGFQLDTSSVVLRNLFRVLDQLPPMWIIPFVSPRNQRSGDMVAGTLVVSDVAAQLSPVRTALAERKAADAHFRFDHAKLARLSGEDYAAVERVLDRWPELKPEEQEPLLAAYTMPLAKKIGVEPPAPAERLQFLEDLLAAELRRRDRKLV
jgi:uncharacterized RDD family membrane protein YckC